MRVLFLYDCLYPHTIGGFERYYREVVIRLARKHQVTYLTRVQWDDDEKPDVPEGVKLIALDCGRDLYTSDGRRRIAPPLRFALGVFAHLIRNRKSYNVMQTCSFPILSDAFVRDGPFSRRTSNGDRLDRGVVERLLASLSRTAVGTDGRRDPKPVRAGYARCFYPFRISADRLAAMGLRQRAVVLRGLLTIPITAPDEDPRPPLFIYAGRHTVEKRVDKFPARSHLRAKKFRTSAPESSAMARSEKGFSARSHGSAWRTSSMSGLRAVVPTGSLAGRGVRFRAPFRARRLRRGGG